MSSKIYEGWLDKYHPEKIILKTISVKLKCRRRWFVLQKSDESSCKYVLTYYTSDKQYSGNNMKGQIDLSQCEHIDDKLKIKYRQSTNNNIFTLKTPKKTYYLAAESEEDMNKWVYNVNRFIGSNSIIINQNNVLPNPSPPVTIPSINRVDNDAKNTSDYVFIGDCITKDTPPSPTKSCDSGFNDIHISNSKLSKCLKDIHSQAPPIPPKLTPPILPPKSTNVINLLKPPQTQVHRRQNEPIGSVDKILPTSLSSGSKGIQKNDRLAYYFHGKPPPVEDNNDLVPVQEPVGDPRNHSVLYVDLKKKDDQDHSSKSNNYEVVITSNYAKLDQEKTEALNLALKRHNK